MSDEEESPHPQRFMVLPTAAILKRISWNKICLFEFCITVLSEISQGTEFLLS